ncbi:Plasmodium exported protein, unknown function [Plasmodium chabaudi chabaudi]|uniref:Uncharacterized protein n=1 Tax=Plasmodium chabaudi chabaudi TaxID=31271 RepID=A0A1D3L6P4_PLACU|nr:Plasmodium exported protein, unknown function [Plasmodium chabaudi chabaudi]
MTTCIRVGNYDLLKKQNNIKVENTLNQVQKPLNKGITKENSIPNNKDNNDDKFIEHEKNCLTQLNINNKKEIIRTKNGNVKVLDISPINKTEEKSNNNPNLDGNDITDFFDNDEIQDLLVEVPNWNCDKRCNCYICAHKDNSRIK